MSDATGHKDRPGVGLSSTTEVVDGIPTNHYTHENPETGRIEVVRGNPPGVSDTAVKEFSDRTTARSWLRNEWSSESCKHLDDFFPRFRLASPNLVHKFTGF